MKKRPRDEDGQQDGLVVVAAQEDQVERVDEESVEYSSSRKNRKTTNEDRTLANSIESLKRKLLQKQTACLSAENKVKKLQESLSKVKLERDKKQNIITRRSREFAQIDNYKNEITALRKQVKKLE